MFVTGKSFLLGQSGKCQAIASNIGTLKSERDEKKEHCELNHVLII